MSNITVVVPPSIRQYVGGQSRVSLEATTVRGALDALATGSDELRTHLFDSTNKINRFVRVFVEGRQTNPATPEEEKVADGAVVTIVLALAGG